MTRKSLSEAQKIMFIEAVICRDGKRYHKDVYDIKISDEADIIVCFIKDGVECIAIDLSEVVKLEGFLRSNAINL